VLDDEPHAFDRGSERVEGNGSRNRRSAPALRTHEEFFGWGAQLSFSGSIRFCVLDERHLLAAAVM